MPRHKQSDRVARGRGDDLKGRTISSRTGGVDTDMLSTLEKTIVVKQLKEDLKDSKPKPMPKGAEPSKDPRTGGSGIAHSGTDVSPTIYAEVYQGRKGGRGKRV